jgi:hypothetical protein
MRCATTATFLSGTWPPPAALPAEAQAKVFDVRKQCHDFYGEEGDKYLMKGDEGLTVFFVSGTMAVLIDELRLCGSGYECIKGVNCATGFTHEVMIYVLSKGSWKKALSVTASEPILLSVDDANRFKSLGYEGFRCLGLPAQDQMGTNNMCAAAVIAEAAARAVMRPGPYT